MFNLKRRITLIAGGSGYLGSAVTSAFLKQGTKLILADIKKPKSLKKGIDFIRCDISKETDLKKLFNYIKDKYGSIDIAVNMTFSNSGKGFYEITPDDWRKGIDTNTTGAFFFSRNCFSLMKENKYGSIIHFSSMYGMVSPNPEIYNSEDEINPIEYGVGKAGIILMVRYLAVKWAKHGIRVNAVAPGAFPNPKVQQNRRFIKALETKIPMGRIGRSEEISGAVIFLASDEASYITGQYIVVDGGWTIW